MGGVVKIPFTSDRKCPLSLEDQEVTCSSSNQMAEEQSSIILLKITCATSLSSTSTLIISDVLRVGLILTSLIPRVITFVSRTGLFQVIRRITVTSHFEARTESFSSPNKH